MSIVGQKEPKQAQLQSRPKGPRAIWGTIGQHREFASALIFFVVMMVLFTIASPSVWLNTQSYSAVFVSLPLYIILTVSLVFVVVAGEIDLSFASVVGVAALAFTEFFLGGWNPYLCVVLAIIAGGIAGIINGILVAYFGLSSLVATLGMNFFWAGFVEVLSNGNGAALVALQGTAFRNVFVGNVGPIPVQLFWGLAFAFVGGLLFARHTFGAHVRFVGDNPESAREMGINVRFVKLLTFVYVGLAAGFVGVLAILINNNFYPTTGQGYLLSVLAAIFVGGTPVFGGVGTVAGAVVGAFTVSFIESGIIAAGINGYWTQLVYGIVIVLSLLTHRLYGPKYKGKAGAI
jgi:simple sugar transport system permease protein